MSTHKKVLMKPIIISNNRKMVIAPKKVKPGVILSNIKLSKMPIYHEDVIYESSHCDFLKGESQEVAIVNKVNLVSKTCRTIAKCTAKGVSVETTSDDVCTLLGQNNYDTVLSALGSVFNEETKVRGILALLRNQTKYRTTATQTDMHKTDTIKKEYVETSCQTLESQIEILSKQKQRKRIRRQQFTPYVVKDNPTKVTKCVINIEDVIKKENVKKEIKNEEKTPDLPDIQTYVDEDSNISSCSIGNMSSISNLSALDLDRNKTEQLLDDIKRVTYNTDIQITVWDGTNIMIPVKPEDEFHIATKDILKNVLREERMKLIWHQAYIDYKKCLQQDEDGYYPLHIAVLQNDEDLIRRQCLALRARREPVDKLAGDMTALQMAIAHNSQVACTRALLRQGADPLLGDAERRSAIHLAAAAATPGHLRALLEHCDAKARQVLQNNEDFWKPELESLTDAQLAKYLYEKIGEMFDDQGNTPLMLAARSGRAEAVSLLASRAPALIDTQSPACGATALYRAVDAACVHAKETGNRTSAPEHFLRTIEVLVGHGADPTIENHSSSSVNTLLTEFNICALSMTIANKMSAMKHGRLASNMMLYKDKEGRIAYEDIKVKERSKIDAVANLKLDGAKRKQEFSTDLGLRDPKCSKIERSNAVGSLSLNVVKDKVTGLKVISNNQTPPEIKTDKKSKIVIMENVSVKADAFLKINMPTTTTVVSKPKDIVLGARKSNAPRYVSIAPKMPISEVASISKMNKGTGKK